MTIQNMHENTADSVGMAVRSQEGKTTKCVLAKTKPKVGALAEFKRNCAMTSTATIANRCSADSYLAECQRQQRPIM
ncbi:MAG: hypothetical protein CVU31_09660 [Betaproteobacteria bacterium HGW-Betaproteobacteria-4]|jgi:hypothetical protein|nr:MAG: hypothetical protein CVU31_09660 [Betaproteobacteria bacterium HGW-Betaproteobacteria-4]